MCECLAFVVKSLKLSLRQMKQWISHSITAITTISFGRVREHTFYYLRMVDVLFKSKLFWFWNITSFEKNAEEKNLELIETWYFWTCFHKMGSTNKMGGGSKKYKVTQKFSKNRNSHLGNRNLINFNNFRIVSVISEM